MDLSSAVDLSPDEAAKQQLGMRRGRGEGRGRRMPLALAADAG